jgi:hypothetical protein
MKNKIVNIGLKNDLKEILTNPENIHYITKGSVSGYSIEICFKEPLSFSSYTYYNNEQLRDSDLVELEKQISEFETKEEIYFQFDLSNNLVNI